MPCLDKLSFLIVGASAVGNVEEAGGGHWVLAAIFQLSVYLNLGSKVMTGSGFASVSFFLTT